MKNTKKMIIGLGLGSVLLPMATNLSAHHSFAIYDIDTKIERTGVLTRFDILQPHIKLTLEAVAEDGSKEIWNVESMAPRRWDQNDLDREFAKVGETVTLIGWPARDGSGEMALSAMVSEEKGEMVIRDEIRQRSAREAADAAK